MTSVTPIALTIDQYVSLVLNARAGEPGYKKAVRSVRSQIELGILEVYPREEEGGTIYINLPKSHESALATE